MTGTSKFAPTPMHGAAYAIAIETIGGINAVGDCNTQERYRESRDKLDAIMLWSRTQPGEIRQAYAWGVDKLDADLRGRLEVHENSQNVRAALVAIPRPDKS